MHVPEIKPESVTQLKGFVAEGDGRKGDMRACRRFGPSDREISPPDDDIFASALCR